MADTAQAQRLLSVEEFVRFVERRPSEEKWELIDGVALMQASPIWRHQAIVRNVMLGLMLASEDGRAEWEALPGLGTAVTAIPRNLPIPDVIVRPRREMEGWITDDAIAVVEVLSPDTRSRDLKRKPELYASVASMQHYLIIDPKRVSVILYGRSGGSWDKPEIKDIARTVELTAIAVSLRSSASIVG